MLDTGFQILDSSVSFFRFFPYPGTSIQDQTIRTVFFKRPAMVEYKMYCSKRNETFEKCSILFKIKEGENSNPPDHHRDRPEYP
jgi:hypothetical protein